MENRKMENRKIITSGKMTLHLILSWFVWGLVFGILARAITANLESNVIGIVLSLIVNVVAVILSWILAVTTNFKQKTVYYTDVPKMIKSLAIFVIIFSIIVDVASFFADGNKMTNTTIISTIISIVVSLAINLAALPIVKKYMSKRSVTQQTEQKQ